MTEAADKDRVQYTNDQARAITTVGESLCVTAGAGSGKTTVLVERYLHLIEAGGLDVDSIVAITFTEKAANQMKEKIREKIGARVTAAESRTEREAWERRSRQIGSAWIHTIHGFCTRLLKENPVEAGVDPRFTMLDETETLLLNHRIIADFINDRLNQDAETMVRLLTDYGLRTVQDMLTSLLNEREAVRLWWDFYLENNDNQILAPLRKRAEADLDRLRSELDSVACSDPGDRLEQLRQAVLETLPPSPITGENLDFLSTGIKLGQGSKKKWGDGPFARAKEILVAIRVRAGQLVSLYDQKRTARDLTLLRALLLEFRLLHDRYRQEKSSRGLVDFEDLLILARDLVTQNPAVRHKYRARIGTVLIDELQDTDPLQMAIVDSICGPDKIPIFGVGDAKQSIYSFRRADVAVFQRFQERIGRHNPDAVIPLSKNFRSQDAILDFINALFKKILSARQQGETDICFDGLEPHKKRVTQDHFVETFFIKSQPGETRAQSIREDEAAWMAARIEAMVDGGEPRILEGEGEIRPVHFGDIAILFRAMSDVKIYEAALRARGIPFTVVSGTGFFHKQEILDVLNILKLVLYPEDEEALAGILRCPVIGVRDDTLFFMTRGRSLSQGLRDAESVEGIDDQERAILRRARQLIGQLRSLRDRVRVPELIGRFLEATAYPALLLTDPIHGHQRCANLKKLMDLARRFGSRAFFGLADFVDYVEELRKRDTREGQSAIDEEANDTVRILTVHKAKGLEFPVVFLPDLGRSSGGRSGPLAIDPALGIGMMTPDGKGGLQDTAIRSFMTAEKKAADLAEEKRLFYVACTRAKDFLLLSGEIGFSKSTNKES
ncbi:MAG: UvrD-helicase domain-containing protein, partial [bacterium]|nr:UvrD-helicase domain-containing protein [bacterium]